MFAGSSSKQTAQGSGPKSGEDSGDPSKPHVFGSSNSKEKETTPQTLWSAMKHKKPQPEHDSPKRASDQSPLQQLFSMNHQLKKHASSGQPANKASDQLSLQQTCVSNPAKPEAHGKSKRTHTTGCKQTQKEDGFVPPFKKQKMDITNPDAAFEAILKFLSKFRKTERPNDHMVGCHSLSSEEKAPTTFHLANNTAAAPICDPPEQSPIELPPQGSLPTADPPRVHLERVGQWEQHLQLLPMDQYVEVFRLANLGHLSHPLLAQEAICQSIQGLLDEMRERVQEGDLVQLQFEGGGLRNPLRSVRRLVGGFSADELINQMGNLMQSNAEICLHGSLRLVMTVIRNRGGKARRVINGVLYSEVIRKKKRHLINPNNTTSNLCFGVSLLAVMSDRLATIPELTGSARLLYCELGFSDEQKILLSDVATFEKHLKVNIGVVMNERKGWQIFRSGPPAHPKTYFVLLHDDHYYGVRNIKAFFGQRNYCTVCGNVYSHSHSCKYRCRLCLEPRCDLQQEERCPNCKIYCNSRACLERHMALASICKTKIFCYSCCAYATKKHTCSGRRCKQCQEPPGEGNSHCCFMPPIKQSKITNKYIFYDFECLQETGIHLPNYIFAMGIKECDTWEFKGADCVSDFVKKFIKQKYEDYTFLAHNAKGYDSYFIVRQLLVEKVDVDLITQEGKLVCVTAKKLGIRFLDTLNFLPVKLAKLPQAMGFKGKSKGFFPHIFNTAANWEYVGPLPKMEDYGVDNMMPGERAEFLSWYQDNQGSVFNLQKELAYYCQQDVKILRKACLLYREEIISMSGIDPFHYVTLADVCMAMYRCMFLKPGTVPLLPHDNYHRQMKRSSTPSIQWLLYLEHKERVEILHALKGGEVKVGPYFLDGYAAVGGRPTAFEFNWCFSHGCPTCFSPTDRNPMTNSTFGDLYEHMQMKVNYLKSQGFAVKHLWEHEWHEMVKADRDLEAFLREKELPSPLLPRDALFGGRTDATCLYYKAKAGEKIHHYYFTSLYPFVYKTMKYPIGHPKIIYKDFAPLSEYFGLAKVKVHPPRGLFSPVLPFQVEGKLLFPLCRTCAEAKLRTCCTHSAEERALEGTWCTIELMKALEKGYRVMSISEVWHFEESSEELFSEYIKILLRQNQEASGYPNWCTDKEKRVKYIQDYLKKEGVQLHPEHIVVNPARRQIAKLFLNSLRGKFGQQSNLVNTSIVRDPIKLLEYAFSPAYEVLGFDIIDDETASVSWKYAKDSFILSENTNVLIDCFTMAYARLQLYDVLDKLQNRCLYHDTDSVIFVSQDGDWDPPLGDSIGDLTSEIPPDQYITEFMSAGPNTYGYRLSGGKVCMKAKGITLDVSNSEKINFNMLKDPVLGHSSQQAPEEIQVQQPSIMTDRNLELTQTGPPKKTLKDVYDNMVLVDNFKTLPYGF